MKDFRLWVTDRCLFNAIFYCGKLYCVKIRTLSVLDLGMNWIIFRLFIEQKTNVLEVTWIEIFDWIWNCLAIQKSTWTNGTGSTICYRRFWCNKGSSCMNKTCFIKHNRLWVLLNSSSNSFGNPFLNINWNIFLNTGRGTFLASVLLQGEILCSWNEWTMRKKLSKKQR